MGYLIRYELVQSRRRPLLCTCTTSRIERVAESLCRVRERRAIDVCNYWMSASQGQPQSPAERIGQLSQVNTIQSVDCLAFKSRQNLVSADFGAKSKHAAWSQEQVVPSIMRRRLLRRWRGASRPEEAL